MTAYIENSGHDMGQKGRTPGSLSEVVVRKSVDSLVLVRDDPGPVYPRPRALIQMQPKIVVPQRDSMGLS
jgi:hypothetical protein